MNKVDSKSKRILVSGGAGFVGSNLCERLLRDGNQVVCIDNLYTGSMDNIRDFQGNDNFVFLQMDILDSLAVEGLKSQGIDEIYHLACPASPIHYQRDAIYTTRVSVEGTIHMLESVAQCSSLQQVRYMVTLTFIRSPRTIMVT